MTTAFPSTMLRVGMAPREAHELNVKSSTKPDEDGEIMSRVLETTWQDLQRDINAAFAESSAVSPDHPCARMVCGADWQRLRDELHGHGRWVDGHYTRTTLVQDERYTVLLLCWPAGVCSPVHAHSDATTKVKSSCFMRILEGELTETLYPPDAIIGPDTVAAHEGHSRKLSAGGYTYIDDSYGLHKVGNASRARAISLHVYAPGWKTVQLYDETERPEATDASGAPLEALCFGDF